MSTGPSSQPISPPVTSTEYSEGISCSPLSFTIDVELGRDVIHNLTLTNTSDYPYAVKIKTTTPNRYALKPTQDIVPPHSSVICKIFFSGPSVLSDNSTTRDKFLVQSVRCPAEVKDLTHFWRERESLHAPKSHRFAYHEQKLKCRLVLPNELNADDNAEREHSTSYNNNSSQLGAATQTTLTPAVTTTSSVAPPSTTSFTSAAQTSASAPAIQRQFERLQSLDPTLTPTRQPSANAQQNSALEQHAAHFQTPQTSHTQARAQSNISAPPMNQQPSNTIPAAAPYTPTAAPIASPQTSTSSSTADDEKRWQELLDLSVQLSTELEAERRALIALTTKYQSALNTVAVQSKQIELMKLQSRNNSAEITSAAPSEQSNAVTSSQSSDAPNDDVMGLRRRRLSAAAANNSTSSLLPAVGQNVSGGITLQLWHIIILTAICFLLGRLFA